MQRRRGLSVLMICLLLFGLAGLASGSSHSFTVTSPTASSTWTPGSSVTITWTGVPTSSLVNLSLVDVNAWTVAAGIASSVPNNGFHTWTVPATLPPGTYLVYIENVERTTWTYGPHFQITDKGDKKLDVGIKKESNGPMVAGQQGSYLLTVANVGNAPVQGSIIVQDQLGAGLSFVSATGTGWTCSASGQTVTCSYPGPIAVGTVLPPLTITVNVAVDAKEVENCAFLFTHESEPDTNLANNRTCVGTPTSPPLAGSICGVKFDDKNGNGKQEPGEAGLPGWTIILTDANGNFVASVTTGPNGEYCFKGLPMGDYTVSEVNQVGWTQVTPAGGTHAVTLTIKQPHIRPVDFGNQVDRTPGIICGIKFHDQNGNGKQDAGEPGLPGWTIVLTDASGNVVATVTTGPNGEYCFTDLPLGTYSVSEQGQNGWTQVYPGTADGAHTVTLTPDKPHLKPVDFGNRRGNVPGTICGVKYYDLNGNGIRDPGEPGLPGWTIQMLDSAGNVVATAVSGQGGKFCFKEVKPGTYTFAEVMQPDWIQTYPASPGTYTVSVVSGVNALTLLFGNTTKPDEEPCCLTFRFRAGRADKFATTDGLEASSPSAALLAAYPAGTKALYFDNTAMDRFFLHTFTLPEDNCIKSAKLEIMARPLGSGSTVQNDSMALLFAGVAGSPTWSSHFGSGQSSPGMLSTPWTLTNYGAGHLFTLDLGTLGLLNTLNTTRFLDFMAQDDTSIDYMVLTVEFCECEETPTGGGGGMPTLQQAVPAPGGGPKR